MLHVKLELCDTTKYERIPLNFSGTLYTHKMFCVSAGVSLYPSVTTGYHSLKSTSKNKQCKEILINPVISNNGCIISRTGMEEKIISREM